MPGQHTVLVVEDDASLRDWCCGSLEDMGYHVRSAGSALEALAIARQAQVSFELGALILSPGQRRNLEAARSADGAARAQSHPTDRWLDPSSGLPEPGSKDRLLKAEEGQLIDVPCRQAVDLLPPGAIRIHPPKAGGADATCSTKKEKRK